MIKSFQRSPIRLGLLLLALALPSVNQAQSKALPRSTPEAQGMSSNDLLAFVEAADEQIDAMNSFMLVRHGQVVAEGWWSPFDAGSNHVLYSLSKSFTSTAVGMAVAEGKLSIDDRVTKFFPNDLPTDALINAHNLPCSPGLQSGMKTIRLHPEYSLRGDTAL